MIEKLVRKNVLQFQPYIPGKPISEVERELGLKNIIKLASNENPLGPSSKAILALKKALNKVFLYPEGSGLPLKQKIAQKLDLKAKNVILGNGSDELIEIIAKTFLNPEDDIIVSEGAFIRYKMAGELMGCRVVETPLKNFTHDLKRMRESITPKTKIIFIANPNNPTGTYVNDEEVKNLMNDLPENIIVVFDEAYYEYVMEKDYPETLNYLNSGGNIIILRTFSKIYGLAGLRVGFGLAKKEIIGFMERIRPPFNVNSLAQEAARASIDDVRQVRKTVQLIKQQKRYLYNALRKLSVSYIPSATNFILIDLKRDAKKISQALLKKGIIVRPMDEYGWHTFIRVTIGLPEENRRFINNLNQILNCRRQLKKNIKRRK